MGFSGIGPPSIVVGAMAGTAHALKVVDVPSGRVLVGAYIGVTVGSVLEDDAVSPYKGTVDDQIRDFPGKYLVPYRGGKNVLPVVVVCFCFLAHQSTKPSPSHDPHTWLSAPGVTPDPPHDGQPLTIAPR
jgi:hypothetical protein